MDGISVVVAHRERTTLRVGDVFLKVDVDARRIEEEARATESAPIPAPRVLWTRPNVLALEALPGQALGRLGTPSAASDGAWRAAGAVVRRLHSAPLPVRAGRGTDGVAEGLVAESAWLVEQGVLDAAVVERNVRLGRRVLRSFEPACTHGDLQVDHVFVDGDVVTGVLDWSEAGRGDPLFDLATLTIGHPDRLAAVLDGYGAEVDLDVVRAWWSVRALLNIRWLTEHGFDPATPGAELDVLRRAR